MANNAVARVGQFNRRTLDVIAARIYFYYSLSYEHAGELASIRRWAHSRTVGAGAGASVVRLCDEEQDWCGVANALGSSAARAICRVGCGSQDAPKSVAC